MQPDLEAAGQRLVELANAMRDLASPRSWPHTRRCPVCGGERVVLSADRLRTLYRCRRCRSVERDPRSDRYMREVRRQIYSSVNIARKRLLQSDRRERWVFQRRRDFLLHIIRPRTLCEVGPGDGGFGEYILPDVERLLLIEESKDFADYLRLRFSDTRVTVLNQDFASIALPEKYDAIAAFQVLEHANDVVSFVSKLLSCVVPGGIVVIETPSADSLEARLFRSRWVMAGILDHRHLLSRRGLMAAVGAAGGEIVALESVEPWWEFFASCIFSILDSWKDFRFGRGRWTSSLCHASAGKCSGALRRDIACRLMHEGVDLCRCLMRYGCQLLERASMGTHWLAGIRARRGAADFHEPAS